MKLIDYVKNLLSLNREFMQEIFEEEILMEFIEALI
jgi:hypothetical protein